MEMYAPILSRFKDAEGLVEARLTLAAYVYEPGRRRREQSHIGPPPGPRNGMGWDRIGWDSENSLASEFIRFCLPFYRVSQFVSVERWGLVVPRTAR